jgi:hypothetical protein
MLCVAVAQPLDGRFVDGVAELAQQLVREESAAHPDLAVNPPDGELQPFLAQRKIPGADMVVDAVDERAVEIEQKGDGGDHEGPIGKAGFSSATKNGFDKVIEP